MAAGGDRVPTLSSGNTDDDWDVSSASESMTGSELSQRQPTRPANIHLSCAFARMIPTCARKPSASIQSLRIATALKIRLPITLHYPSPLAPGELGQLTLAG